MLSVDGRQSTVDTKNFPASQTKFGYNNSWKNIIVSFSKFTQEVNITMRLVDNRQSTQKLRSNKGFRNMNIYLAALSLSPLVIEHSHKDLLCEFYRDFLMTTSILFFSNILWRCCVIEIFKMYKSFFAEQTKTRFPQKFELVDVTSSATLYKAFDLTNFSYCTNPSLRDKKLFHKNLNLLVCTKCLSCWNSNRKFVWLFILIQCSSV